MVNRYVPLDGGNPIGRRLLDGSFALPQLTLDWPSVQWNSELMSNLCSANDVHLAPHSKETMCRQILDEQTKNGVWAISVADFAQLRTLRGYGHRRFLLANEVVEPNVARTLMLATDVEVTYVVDSPDGVKVLDDAWMDAQRTSPVDVLIEVGFRGGRAGCRTLENVLAVAAAVSACRGLRLAGIEAYDGIVIDLERFSGSRVRDSGMSDMINEQVKLISECIATLRSRDLMRGTTTVSLGGSMFFDIAIDGCNKQWRADHDAILVLRCGSYIVHDDDGIYDSISALGKMARPGGLRSALAIWSVVLSRPENDLAIIGFGKQHCPEDDGLPRLHSVVRGGRPSPIDGANIYRLNEQHAYCRLQSESARDLKVGDVVVSAPYHPSLVFQKWQRMLCIDDSLTVLDVAESNF